MKNIQLFLQVLIKRAKEKGYSGTNGKIYRQIEKEYSELKTEEDRMRYTKKMVGMYYNSDFLLFMEQPESTRHIQILLNDPIYQKELDEQRKKLVYEYDKNEDLLSRDIEKAYSASEELSQKFADLFNRVDELEKELAELKRETFTPSGLTFVHKDKKVLSKQAAQSIFKTINDNLTKSGVTRK